MRISVITISYNAEDVIADTIQSVIEQNFSDYEYIFVDGGSKDKTNNIIDSYVEVLRKKNIPITHISEPDKGISDAFNKGVINANGEIIAILNAADIMLPGTLKYISENFPETIDVLYGNIIWNNENRNLSYVRESKPVSELDGLKYNMIIMHPAAYIKASAYKKYGVYDTSFKYAMDTELLYKMYKNRARFEYIDREFAIVQAGGVSDSYLIDGLKELSRIPLSYGDSKIKVYFLLTKKLLFHKLAHFYRFVLMKK